MYGAENTNDTVLYLGEGLTKDSGSPVLGRVERGLCLLIILVLILCFSIWYLSNLFC